MMNMIYTIGKLQGAFMVIAGVAVPLMGGRDPVMVVILGVGLLLLRDGREKQ